MRAQLEVVKEVKQSKANYETQETNSSLQKTPKLELEGERGRRRRKENLASKRKREREK